ncbi:MAG: histidinol-phosphate transaminase [Propionibacteriaceae bacterium]|jgi:histidinol-phosphate aminotransferase|nr:histidinol-phosphate transaminase [Propionibacteriaceae bacterium]
MADFSWEALPLRPELREARPYGAPQLDLPVCLNVNENPYPPTQAVIADMTAAVNQAAHSIHRYPDREARTLRSKLAKYLGHDLTTDQIWAANGSNEIWIQILGAFGGPGRTMLSFTPSYSMYPEYARDTHTGIVTTSRSEDYQITTAIALEAIAQYKPDVVAIASPNNPTGTLTDLDVLEEILAATTGIVVVDEAYQEFADAHSALTLLPQWPNLLVTRTMSKAFAFAGGRVGYVAASSAVIDALRVVRLPYHLSAITQAVASVALDHAEEMLAQVQYLKELREQTMVKLWGLDVTIIDSQANFFLFGPFPDPHATWQALVDRGVLVRETGVESYLRVCVGTGEEMSIFVNALSDVLTMERNPQ